MAKVPVKSDLLQDAADKVSAYIPKQGVGAFPLVIILPLILQVIEAIFKHCQEEQAVETARHDGRASEIVDRHVRRQLRKAGKGPFMIGFRAHAELAEQCAQAMMAANEDAKPEEIVGLCRAAKGKG